jgi:hypothetical protein
MTPNANHTLLTESSRRLARLSRVLARYDLVEASEDARDAGLGEGVRGRVAAHRIVAAGRVPHVRIGHSVFVQRGTFAALAKVKNEKAR